MDYCSSCRRHLNGALACPGCGAYAPDIAPRAVPTPWQAPADSAWHDGTDYPEGADEVVESAEDSYDDSPAVAAGPLGRAARRRQRVRWKKTQRRALVATAVALVGGGLTVASLDRQSTDRAQAASAPDTTTMGVADEEATEPTPSASTPTGRHRAPDPTPSARSTATANAPHEQTVGTPQATSTPRRRLTVISVPSTTSSAAQPQAAAAGTASGSTATPSEPTATPTPTADDSTPAQPASPAPTATAPSQLCLLVICIG
ncbi:hypothetical protein AB0N16_31260 [Streptomyces sp. NPDC051105]|uniref:SCO2400 family protein n=1 Tax=Streptomyces sp. NPDC051105 TaxID=3154843 RepID=UPI0034404307